MFFWNIELLCVVRNITFDCVVSWWSRGYISNYTSRVKRNRDQDCKHCCIKQTFHSGVLRTPNVYTIGVVEKNRRITCKIPLVVATHPISGYRVSNTPITPAPMVRRPSHTALLWYHFFVGIPQV